MNIKCVYILINYKLDRISVVLDELKYQAQELSPCVIIFHCLDELIASQTEPNEKSLRSMQITEIFVTFVEECNRFSTVNHLLPTDIDINSLPFPNNSILMIATVVDPSCLHSSLLAYDVFHTVFSCNAIEDDECTSRDRLQNNLLYFKSRVILPSSMKPLILLHCNQWFKNCTHSDIEVFIDRCMLYSQSMNVDIRQTIIDIGSSFIPPSMRTTFRTKDLNNNQSNDDQQWSNIGGLQEVKRELLDIFSLPTEYSRIFSALSSKLRVRSGVLLYGPSGSGKSMLASAVARKCSLNMIRVCGAELLNKYVGASEAAVRDVFQRAAQSAPCMIFFDELDALAPKRGSNSTAVTDRVVNQLLTFLDGVESRSGVYIIAASSRPQLIDSALLRPGRIDRKLFCSLPTTEEREDIVSKIIKSAKMDISQMNENVCQFIANQTQDFSGADLSMIFSVAQTNAFHRCLEIMEKQKMEEEQDIDITDAVIINSTDLHSALQEVTLNVLSSRNKQQMHIKNEIFTLDPQYVGLKSVQK